MKTHRNSQPQGVLYGMKCSVTMCAWRRLRAACATRLLAWLLAFALPAVAQAQFSYTVQNGTITITGYSGPGGAVGIPATIGGLPVTSIGIFAFFAIGSLTSVT